MQLCTRLFSGAGDGERLSVLWDAFCGGGFCVGVMGKVEVLIFVV